MTRAIPSSFHLNNGRARVYIMPYKPPRFKNNTFIPINEKCQNVYRVDDMCGALQICSFYAKIDEKRKVDAPMQSIGL